MTRGRISHILELEYSCHSKLVSTLPMLLLSVLSWRVSQAWNPRQLKLSQGYLKLVTVSSVCLFTLIFVLMPMVLFVITDLHAVGCGGFV